MTIYLSVCGSVDNIMEILGKAFSMHGAIFLVQVLALPFESGLAIRSPIAVIKRVKSIIRILNYKCTEVFLLCFSSKVCMKIIGIQIQKYLIFCVEYFSRLPGALLTLIGQK